VDVEEPRPNDIFDRELRRALAAEGGAAAGPHLDAELAAAWMERQLDPAAARSIEAHLAGCQECQILIATLARIAPEAAPADLGLAWWRRLRAGWLIPATVAAAAALVIWVAVPEQRRAASTSVDEFQARVERAPAPLPAEPQPTPAPEAAQSAAADAKADASRRDARQAPQSANELDTLEKKEAEAEAFAPAPSLDRLERRERFADTGASPPAPAAAPAPASQPPSPAPREQAKALQDSITIASESPARANDQQDAASATQRSLGAAGAVAGRLVQSPLQIAAPDGARWRRTGTALEFARRADGAFTATTMPVTADAINAGAAPGGTVCWLAGNNGIVLVSMDGVRFARVTPPAAVNLVAVTAADARVATVTTADGRRFRTTDAGATWSPAP
jgi:hypothetical protein